MKRSNKYNRAFFYVSQEYPDSGPVSLYKRVRQVFSTPRLLEITPERLAKLAKTWPMTPPASASVVTHNRRVFSWLT